MIINQTKIKTMLMSYLLDLPIEKCVGTGTGTGINIHQLKQKIKVLNDSKQFHGPINDTYEILQTFGGFEIVQMCSAMLESYENDMIILVDGFIGSCGYLAASKINPNIINNTFFSHKSTENGHQLLLDKINATPILDLKMRLGEGTGCALAYPVIENAVNFMNDMATFENAKVSRQSND